jgi:hypothetical protein
VKSLIPIVLVSVIFLSSCATQKSQPAPQPQNYTISGTVADLAVSSGGLVLQNNDTDNVSVTSNGTFHFATAIASGDAYKVTVFTQPSTPVQQCSVQNGVGTATSDVTNIKIECGHNEWAWISGSQALNPSSVYGTLGTAAANNSPSGRGYAVSSVDSSGNLWLFGGSGVDSNGALLPMNDLWKFSAGQWTWMSGPTVGSQSGIYGTLGVPSTNTIPGAREEATSWTDASGNFWIFGGMGFDAVGFAGSLNDLWKYSNGEWTWMGGASVANQHGIYGTLGVPSANNSPGARIEASVWVDVSGDVWLFGGYGYDDGSSVTLGMLSDLWKYSAGQWTWMGGPKVVNQKGFYGTKGVASASSFPSGRMGAFNWTDKSGNFWLFGGGAYDSTGNSGIINDLWKYSAGQWTWMGGSNLVNQTGLYGTQGTPSAINLPGARANGITWTDASGNGWLFGGNGYYGPSTIGELNDLWKFSGGQWTWVSGSSLGDQASAFGTQGSLMPGTSPGGRIFSTGWIDANGNLWLFGGSTIIGGTSGNWNDVWMYMP